MKKLSLFVAIIVLITSNIFASGGSIYTRFGKGDITTNFFGRSTALNGAGNALGSEGHISLNNPAGLYLLKLTTFESGLNYSGSNLSGNDGSAFYSETSFSGFVFSIPLEKELGISIAAGIVPITNVNYEVIEKYNDSEYGVYNIRYSGSGGISKLFVSISYKTPIDYVIGGTFNYYTGNNDYTGSVEFESGSDFTDGAYINRHGHHGLGGTFGIITPEYSEIFGSKNVSNFRIGAYFDFMADLTTDTSITSSTSNGESIVTAGSVDADYPYTLGIGAGFTLSKDYNIFLDYLFQPWSTYKLGNISQQNMQDIYKISAGFEHKKANPRLDDFWSTLILRAGLGYEQTHLKLNGESINMMSVSAGLGFPISEGGYIDIGLIYGRRGTKSNSLFAEDVLKATFSISFGELWFVREER